ncbi:MAG: amidohydrolase [Clostridiales bacterium]|nr:MAG: amidohydrolase [Clostridiales bacterium]
MDLILINGNVVTMDTNNKKAEAFAVKAGKFVKVGTNKDVLELKDDNTEVIDLKGKTVVPGFNEAHMHLLNSGYNMHKIDLNGAKSIKEVIERSKKYISMKKPQPGEWILGFGWNQMLFEEKRNLTRNDLDQISTDNPICFIRVCVHSAATNSKAIEIAGITKDTPQPVGGKFYRDENGEPTGIFSETARYMIYDMIPDAGVNEIKEMIMDAAKVASGYGVTSVQTDDFEAMPGKDWRKVLKAYSELVEEGILPVRIYEQCLLPDMGRLKEFLDEGYKTGQGDEYFKIGPLKLLTDGSLGARTAYLSEPYADDPSTSGIYVFSQDELDELACAAHEGGLQLVFHAIGDGAMRQCFKAFEKAQNHKFKEDPRFGIIHLQITDEFLLEEFKRQNVVAYAEPICLNNDIHMAEDRVGKERAKVSYNYRTLFDSGVHVSISSDWPVDSVNPMKNIYVGVTRKDYDGYPEGGWNPEQRLTIEQALYGFTMGSAYASFEEELKGSVEDGKLADFVVLSEDILEIEPDKIQDIEVEMTFMGGKLVYSKA